MVSKEHTYIVSDDAPGGGAVKHLTKQEFGRRLYSLMLRKGWRQSDLSRESHIGRDAISTYVRGKVFPTEVNLQRLAKALDVEPEFLLPNIPENAIENEKQPDFEMKVSMGNTRKAWVRLNRLMSLATAVKIAELVEADRFDDDKSANGS